MEGNNHANLAWETNVFYLILEFTKTDLTIVMCVMFAWINDFKENISAGRILDTMSAAFVWR